MKFRPSSRSRGEGLWWWVRLNFEPAIFYALSKGIDAPFTDSGLAFRWQCSSRRKGSGAVSHTPALKVDWAAIPAKQATQFAA